MSMANSLIGSTIAGRYRIEARVGSGAMGAVYRAEQAGLGRRVALKIVNRDRQVDGDTIARFRREATALSALHHPNTVRVFDFGSTTSGLLFLAMELLEGEPLTDRLLRDGPLPLSVALSVTQQVLRSIGEAHARGIVHRDLKPDNIFLARVRSEHAPIVKVLDFGIAKAVAGDCKIDQFETLDGTVFGTPRYMSPEQAAGRTLDPRSDLYSVGIMLYELVAGHPPFVDSDAVVVMARHIRDAPELLSRAAPLRNIPPSLDAVVSRALTKRAEDRFQSADEFERALDACATELSLLTRRPAAAWIKSNRKLLSGATLAIALAATGVWLTDGSASTGPELDVTSATDVADRVPMPASAAKDTDGRDGQDGKDGQDGQDGQDGKDGKGAQTDMQAALAAADNGDDDRRATATERSVVSVQTAPPAAAAVLKDGSELGVTPLDVSMSRGTTLTLLLKKKGFAEKTLELRADDGARVVTLRKLRDRDKHRGRNKPGAGPRRQREHAPSMSASPNTSEHTDEPQTPSLEKSSPYERF